jgi:small subunit ribosomal protein S16
MLVIRLARIGRKNAAKFRLVLQEKTQAPKSKAQEILGSYDPHAKERNNQVHLETDRIKYWLSQGAQPSATVHNMLIEFGLIEGKKRRVVQPKKKAGADGEGEAAPAASAAPTEAGTADAKAEEKTEEKAAA